FDIAEAQGPTEFLGYDTEKAEGQITALVRDGAQIASAKAGETVQIVVNQSPFYAESGGQVGDAGLLKTDGGLAKITDTKKVQGVFIHFAEVTEGEIAKGQGAELSVDHARRAAIRANHSATHLLNEALRNTLGDHIAQRGSLNAPDRLRFDFSHAKAITPEEMAAVETEINAVIRQNGAVETRIMTPDEARALGAQALFGEKYGDEVRVVAMGEQAGSGKGSDGKTYSLELCGGTHVARLGEIGLCVILSDSASSAGVRRIEALTGAGALAYLAEQRARLADVAATVKAAPAELSERVKALVDERRALQNEVAQLRRELAMGGGAAGGQDAREINGVRFVSQVVSGVSGKDLPALIDELKGQIGSGAVLLIADTGGKAAVAAGVTADLTGRLSAVEIVKAAAVALGGKGGGGRADMAQAGGADASKADEAIKAAEAVIGA
ncbi:alanine--tRNA ligase, partial [Thioclava sp. BHET1]